MSQTSMPLLGVIGAAGNHRYCDHIVFITSAPLRLWRWWESGELKWRMTACALCRFGYDRCRRGSTDHAKTTSCPWENKKVPGNMEIDFIPRPGEVHQFGRRSLQRQGSGRASTNTLKPRKEIWVHRNLYNHRVYGYVFLQVLWCFVGHPPSERYGDPTWLYSSI